MDFIPVGAERGEKKICEEQMSGGQEDEAENGLGKEND